MNKVQLRLQTIVYSKKTQVLHQTSILFTKTFPRAGVYISANLKEREKTRLTYSFKTLSKGYKLSQNTSTRVGFPSSSIRINLPWEAIFQPYDISFVQLFITVCILSCRRVMFLQVRVCPSIISHTGQRDFSRQRGGLGNLHKYILVHDALLNHLTHDQWEPNTSLSVSTPILCLSPPPLAIIVATRAAGWQSISESSSC